MKTIVFGKSTSKTFLEYFAHQQPSQLVLKTRAKKNYHYPGLLLYGNQFREDFIEKLLANAVST
jgi:hypothetical protein